MVRSEVLTRQRNVNLRLNGVALENLPVRTERMADVPHELDDGLGGTRKIKNLLSLPGVAVSTGACRW